jgi:mannose-6-phosphate isomerase
MPVGSRAVRPVPLPANPLPRFYKGGSRIARLRGIPEGDDKSPEDWIGSVTTAFGSDRAGLSRLEDGRTLAHVIDADPEAFLGPEHVPGRGPALLVKLLDAGERLPVHFHPDRAFARRHLASPFGKSEGWIVLATEGADAAVFLGLREPVEEERLADWVERQDAAALLAALNRIPTEPGDTFFVPAGLLHAIGEGILILELQEPSDLSVLLEWGDFDLDGRVDGHLGLGFATALQAAERDRLEPDELGNLMASRLDDDRPGVERLFPPEADDFFRAERIRPVPSSPLPQGFSILVVLSGEGRLATEAGELPLQRGATVLVPWSAGEGVLDGRLEVLRCLPPAGGA